MSYHGGALLSQARVNFIFWGTWDGATESRYATDWLQMMQIPAFWLRLREYNIGIGTSGSQLNYTDGVAGCLTEATLRTGITDALNRNGLTPTSQDVYVVFLPSGTRDGDNDYDSTCRTGVDGGHHDHYTATVGGTQYNVRYAIVEGSPDSTIPYISASHEIEEAATDPDPHSGWYDSSDHNNEIGDLCEGGRQAQIANITNAQMWSQVACRCVREVDLNTVDTVAGIYASGAAPPFTDTNQWGGFSNETVFRPANVTWYPLQGSTVPLFGDSTTLPYAGDYSGDGRTEFSVFENGVIHNLDLRWGTSTTVTLGQAGDQPAPGDYDGDGKTDNAVWRPSDGTWHIIMSKTGSTITQQWGLTGDFPVAADYDLDGITDLAVWRPTQNGSNLSYWYVLPSTTPGIYWWSQWGLNGDVPVPGDYNADGASDWVTWRPSEGNFYTSYNVFNCGSCQGFSYAYQLGQFGDIPVTRDYDADWFTDFSVWRPTNSGDNWFVVTSRDWTFKHNQWGLNGDKPIQRNWLAYP